MFINYNQSGHHFSTVALGSQFAGVSLCDVGFHYTEPSHVYGPALREYYLIHFVLSGQGTFLTGDKTYCLKTGDSFLIHPKIVTTYQSDKDNPWAYFWIGFVGADAQKLIENTFGGNDVLPFDLSLAPVPLESILYDSGNNEKYYLKTVSLLFALLSSVMSDKVKVKKPLIIENAVHFIEQNYHNPFNISVLAHELGVSRAYFSTLFTKTVGRSPYGYLNDFRLNKACELLKNHEDITITETAYSVGFQSIERFSEMFKNKTGLSPLKYRQKYFKE